jgi:hypothetical protein
MAKQNFHVTIMQEQSKVWQGVESGYKQPAIRHVF